MIKSYLLCEVEVTDKMSKEFLQELKDLVTEEGFLVRNVYKYLKDKKGNYVFLKGTRKAIKESFASDVLILDSDDCYKKYVDYLATSNKIMCRFDNNDKELLAKFEVLVEKVRKLIEDTVSLGNPDEHEVYKESNLGSLKESSIFQTPKRESLLEMMNSEGDSEVPLSTEESSVKEFEKAYNDLVSLYKFVNENKLRLPAKEIRHLTDKIDYVNGLIKGLIIE